MKNTRLFVFGSVFLIMCGTLATIIGVCIYKFLPIEGVSDRIVFIAIFSATITFFVLIGLAALITTLLTNTDDPK